MKRELPPPGVQDTGKAGSMGADETRIVRETFEGRCRRRAQGVGGDGLMRADEGSERLRDGEGEEAVRPGKRLLQVVGEPLLGCLMLTLRAVTMATGMMDAVVPPTAVALREAMAVVAAAAVLDGADDLAGRGGERGRTRKGLWRTGGEDLAAGGHGRSPCMRALRRSEASACPVWVRWKETMVVSRWGCPRERWMSRGCTPASSRGVADACRRVGMATPILVMPARCVAVRKAPWTLVRRMGEGAVGRWC